MPSIADTVTEVIQWVFPEHAGAPGQIHGGRMMQWITQAGTMAAARVARGSVVLGAMDDIDFLHPVSVGQIAILRAQVEYVGTSSLEVGVKVLAEQPWSGEVRHACTAYLTFVHLGPDLRPRPCRSFTPGTAGERRRWEAALVRRERRLERVKRLKAAIQA